MNNEEYRKLYQMEKYYWWFVGRRIIIKKILKKYLPQNDKLSILDYGSGSGGNLPLLSEFGQVIGTENSDLAIELSKKNSAHEVYKIEPNQSPPFSQNYFDLITLFDVLEHIPEDQKFLKNMGQYLKPGGLLFITAPAYRFLWSEHDEALGHYRRYTAGELIQELKSANFKPIYYSYTFSFFLPLTLIYRLFKNLAKKILRDKKKPAVSYTILPPAINKMFILFLKIEAYLLGKIKFPFGTSVLILAKIQK